MLEIFLLIYLSRRIRNIVEPKGYKGGKWQGYLILLWIGAEIAGILISMLGFGSDQIIGLISGYLCAAAAAIYIFKRAESLPDISSGGDDWLNNMGNDNTF